MVRHYFRYWGFIAHKTKQNQNQKQKPPPPLPACRDSRLHRANRECSPHGTIHYNATGRRWSTLASHFSARMPSTWYLHVVGCFREPYNSVLHFGSNQWQLLVTFLLPLGVQITSESQKIFCPEEELCQRIASSLEVIKIYFSESWSNGEGMDESTFYVWIKMRSHQEVVPLPRKK